LLSDFSSLPREPGNSCATCSAVRRLCARKFRPLRQILLSKRAPRA
jgi:hypothetical protein